MNWYVHNNFLCGDVVVYYDGETPIHLFRQIRVIKVDITPQSVQCFDVEGNGWTLLPCNQDRWFKKKHKYKDITWDTVFQKAIVDTFWNIQFKGD